MATFRKNRHRGDNCCVDCTEDPCEECCACPDGTPGTAMLGFTIDNTAVSADFPADFDGFSPNITIFCTEDFPLPEPTGSPAGFDPAISLTLFAGVMRDELDGECKWYLTFILAASNNFAVKIFTRLLADGYAATYPDFSLVIEGITYSFTDIILT